MPSSYRHDTSGTLDMAEKLGCASCQTPRCRSVRWWLWQGASAPSFTGCGRMVLNSPQSRCSPSRPEHWQHDGAAAVVTFCLTGTTPVTEVLTLDKSIGEIGLEHGFTYPHNFTRFSAPLRHRTARDPGGSARASDGRDERLENWFDRASQWGR